MPVHNLKTAWTCLSEYLKVQQTVTMASALTSEEAITSLQAITLPSGSWRNSVPFAANKPLIGDLVGRNGMISCVARWPRWATVRALRFSVQPIEGGSKLEGMLELRFAYYCYELAMIALTTVTCAIDVWAFIARSSWHGNFISDFLGLAVLWCLIRFAPRLGRKREVELLSNVQTALAQKPTLDALNRRPSTTTEVFLRPRHERFDN